MNVKSPVWVGLAVGALLLVELGGASTTFTDPTGDSDHAPDIARVIVSDSSEAGATFRVLLRGGGQGTVTSKPSGIACGVVCSSSFDEGKTVVVRATPRNGSRFRGWSGDCIGKSRLCTLVAHGRQTVRARFTRIGPFEDVGETVYTRPVLNVTRAGPGGRVTSSPSGIDCPPLEKCSNRFDRGDRVTLRAVAPSGFTFVGWSGLLVGCPGRPSCSIRMNATTDVTATFTRP